MASDASPTWSFLTNHACVLLCIAQQPDIRLREIGDRVGITERAAYNIVTELADDGYITRERAGRRNRYTIHPNQPLPDHLAHRQSIGDVLAILTTHDRTSIDPGSLQDQHPGHTPGTRSRSSPRATNTRSAGFQSPSAG
jgi:hypothetical protein